MDYVKSQQPDIIFENAGKTDAVKLDLDAVRPGGAVALAGVAGTGGKTELDSDYFIFNGCSLSTQ